LDLGYKVHIIADLPCSHPYTFCGGRLPIPSRRLVALLASLFFSALQLHRVKLAHYLSSPNGGKRKKKKALGNPRSGVQLAYYTQ
jgi:hypothetical protein